MKNQNSRQWKALLGKQWAGVGLVGVMSNGLPGFRLIQRFAVETRGGARKEKMTMRRTLRRKGIAICAGMFVLTSVAIPSLAQTTFIANGDFESGDLTGWTPGSSGSGGIANVVNEGTCFSAYETRGLILSGEAAARLRSAPPATTDSIGYLTSDPFSAGLAIKFKALSETNNTLTNPNPVTFQVRVLDGSGNALVSQIVATNIVALSVTPDTCGGGSPQLNGAFSEHAISTSAFIGQTVQVEFSQHTNNVGSGWFTLIDDVEAIPDADGDGFPPPEDCDESNPDINPDAIELPGNVVDEDCNGDLGSCTPCSAWRNHGEYIRCVSHAVEDLVISGDLAQDEADAIVSSAAGSDIGRKGFTPAECE